MSWLRWDLEIGGFLIHRVLLFWNRSQRTVTSVSQITTVQDTEEETKKRVYPAPLSITVPCGVCRPRQVEHVAPQQIEPGGLEFISPLTWRSMQLQLHTLHSLWLMQVPRHCWCLGRFHACRSLLTVGGGGRKSDKPYTASVTAVSHIPSGLWASHSRFSSTVMRLICFHYRHHHNQYWRCVTKVTGFASFSSLTCKFKVGLRPTGPIWRNQTPRSWETNVFFN